MIIHKKVYLIIFLLTFIMLLNCTYAQKSNQVKGESTPGWVNEPHKYYSENKYLVGVGSGDTRSAAEKDAVGNIAKIFQSKVKVDQTLVENYFETMGKEGSELSQSSQMLRQTSIASNQDLKNIKIEEAFFSQTEGVYYVVALMDRAETAAFYVQDMANNDKKIQEHFTNYQNSGNKLHRFAYLNKAKMISAVNGILGQQYQIITGGQEAPVQSITENQIDKELRLLLDQITVTLSPAAGTADEVSDYLKETVGKIGFKIVQNSGDFSFKYSLDIKPTELNQPNTVAYNWKLTIQVNDNLNNFALKAFNIEKRTVAISEGEAKGKIMRLVRSELDKSFYKQFLNYVNSL